VTTPSRACNQMVLTSKLIFVRKVEVLNGQIRIIGLEVEPA
jgi:hypothetical protein